MVWKQWVLTFGSHTSTILFAGGSQICQNRLLLLQLIFSAVVKVRAYSSCLGSFNCGLINRRLAYVVASH